MQAQAEDEEETSANGTSETAAGAVQVESSAGIVSCCSIPSFKLNYMTSSEVAACFGRQLPLLTIRLMTS